MENVKYILIVSQLSYSHHCFVVSASEDNYREKALTLIEKLEDYKRIGSNQSDYEYGYPRDEAYTDISVRWNVNDQGNIYFIPCSSILDAMNQAAEYHSTVKFDHNFKGIRKKQLEILEAVIFQHHRFNNIKDIVGSVFNIL